MTDLDRRVVYRFVRHNPQEGTTLDGGVGWWPKVTPEGLKWKGNFFSDEPVDWSDAGKLDVRTPRHFVLTRDDGTTYEFYPLTIGDLRRTNPYLCDGEGLDSDWDAQEYFPSEFFGPVNKAEYEEYVRIGGIPPDFSTEEGNPASEARITENKAFDIDTIRKWRVARTGNPDVDFAFFKKVAADKWIQLPKVDDKGAVVSPGSEAWKDSDPSLPASSADAHKVPQAGGGWAFSQERSELHARIVDGIFRGKQKGKPPTAVFMFGPPASGKSSTRRIRKREEFASLDPDEIREHFPEFGEAVAKKVRNAGSLTHEETRYVNNAAFNQAMSEGYDFVADSAGGTSQQAVDWYKEQFKLLREKGYKIQIYIHHTPDLDKVLIRNEARGIRQGRFVPTGMIKDAFSFLPSLKSAYEDFADDFGIFDTSGVDEDPPGNPREVYSSGSGRAKSVADPSFMRSHFNTEASMPKAGERADMSPEAVKARLVADLVADAEWARTAPVITTPGEGVTWPLFEPGPLDPNYIPDPDFRNKLLRLAALHPEGSAKK